MAPTATPPPTTRTTTAARHRRPILPTKNPDVWNISDSGISSRRAEGAETDRDGGGADHAIGDISSQRRRSTSIRLPFFFSSCCGGSQQSKKNRRRRQSRRRRIVLSSAVIMGAVLYFLIHVVGLTMFLGSGAVPPLGTHSHDFENDCLFFSHDYHSRLPVLIVGGTDGSGTRAVVDTLGSLGVTIVADDDQTMDIHASALFRKQGWPALVTTFLDATGGSLTDDFETLPTTTQQILLREMKSLQKYIARKYANENRRNRQRPDLFRHFRKSSTQEHEPNSMAHASKVAFVIKAPATLLVLPILWKFFQPIRFIHVVRDGRDIALSDNQSPVLKFYNVTYPQDYEERSKQYNGEFYPIRAMQLWNDWNLQIHHWATAKTAAAEAPFVNESSSAVPSFGYMVLRTEDLVVVDSSSSTKFHALTRLADFVGSSLTPQQLCCLAKAPPRDYGQSNIHSETINNHMSRHGGNAGKAKGAARNSRTGSDDAMVDHPTSQKERFTNYSHQHPTSLDANQLAMEIQEKEAELERLHAQLHQMGGSDQENRRRLSAGVPKLVPSLFLKQLAAWQDTVHLSAAEYQTETLQKLIGYGQSLFTQYKHNRQALESEISPKEIQDTIDYLRKLLENRGVPQEDPPKSKQHMMHQSINARYGKWKAKLANRTQVSVLLHQEGKDGLQLFGYEPRKEWDYSLQTGRIPSDADFFACDRSIACGRTRLRAQKAT